MGRSQRTRTQRIVGGIDGTSVRRRVRRVGRSLMAVKTDNRGLFRRGCQGPVLCTFLVTAFGRLSNVGTVLCCTPEVFRVSNMFASSTVVRSVIVKLAGLAFAVVKVVLVSRMKQGGLLCVNSVNVALSLTLMTGNFCRSTFSNCCVLVYLVKFVTFFTVSLNTIV